MAKKVAYVTGGMGGIGTSICQRLHKEGFTVIAGCGPSRDHKKWIDEQQALGYTFHASVGNVAEWVETGGCAPGVVGPCRTAVRGGSYASALATDLRTWSRQEVDVSSEVPWIGFRCAYAAVGLR